MIERILSEKISAFFGGKKAITIMGARQVGKSTLIKHTFPNFNKANFDDNLTRLQAK